MPHSPTNYIKSSTTATGDKCSHRSRPGEIERERCESFCTSRESTTHLSQPITAAPPRIYLPPLAFKFQNTQTSRSSTDANQLSTIVGERQAVHEWAFKMSILSIWCVFQCQTYYCFRNKNGCRCINLLPILSLPPTWTVVEIVRRDTRSPLGLSCETENHGTYSRVRARPR